MSSPQPSLSSQFTGQTSEQLADEATVLANYEVGQRLGEGAYGSVYEAKYIPSGQRFALKVLQKDDLLYMAQHPELTQPGAMQTLRRYNEALERHIIKEATTMQSLEHPHVVKFYKFLNSTVAYYFILDLAEGGELFDLIISEKYFGEDEARNYFQQLISALDYCHRKGIAHKDLKAENLLLASDNRLLVCDFGFSTKCVEDLLERQELDLDSTGESGETGFQGAGTLHYMSPEAVMASSQNLFDYFSGFQNDSMFADSTADPMRLSGASSSAFTNGTGSPLVPKSVEESWTSGAEISVVKNKKEKTGFFQTLISKKPAVGTSKDAKGSGSASSATGNLPGTSKEEKAPAVKHQDPNTNLGQNRAVVSTTPPADLASHVSVDAFQQDLWSAAVILFFMLTGRLPFNGRDDEETLHLIQEANVKFTPEEERRLSADVKDLLRKMMHRDPTARLSRDEVIRHRWFQQGLQMRRVFPHLFSNDDEERVERSTSFLKFKERKNESVTTDEEAFLHSAFKAINTDELGGISRDQLRDALTTLGKEASNTEDVTELMRLFTGDGSRQEVTFAEFRKAWVSKDLEHANISQKKHFQLENIVKLHPKHLEPLTVRLLRSAFDSVDVEHTGVITVEQLRRFFQRYNIRAETADLVSLIHLFRGCASSAATAASPVTATAPAAVKREEADCISFDVFVSGIQEALLRHPMGRKLAVATNLNALFHTYNVKDCLFHGILVSGEPNGILRHLLQAPGRLTLLHASDIRSTTGKTYTFRYSSDDEHHDHSVHAARVNPESPFFNCRGSGLPPRYSRVDGSDFQARRSSMRASIANTMPMRHCTASLSIGFRLRNVSSSFTGAINNGSGKLSTVLPVRTESVLPGNKSVSLSAGNVCASKTGHIMPNSSLVPSLLGANSPLVSTGSGTMISPTDNSAFSACEVDVTLSPICSGYVLVRFRRIYGRTNCFHESVDFISNLLVPEREQAMQDTMPRGESELM